MNNQEYLKRLWYLQNMRPRDLLDELLATIHGDMEYVTEHGLPKAVVDAEVKWVALQSKNDPTPDSVSGD